MFAQQSISQSYIKTFDSIIENTSSASLEQQIDRFFNDVIKKDSLINAAKLSHTIFIHYYKKEKNYKRAIKYGLIEVSCYEKLKNSNKEYNQILYNLGWAYYRLEEFENSIMYHEKVINLNYSEYRVAQSYCEIGRNFSRLGDVFKAEEFYLKGIAMLEEQKKYKNLVGKYFGLANVYLDIDSKNSLKKQLDVLKKLDNINLTDRQKLSLNNYYAFHYNKPKTFNFKKARYYYRKNLDAAIKAKDSVFIGKTYMDLSDIYNQIEHDSALYFANKSFGYPHNNLNVAFYQKSWAYLIQDDFENALLNINKSIESVIKIDSTNNLPLKTDFSNVSEKSKLLTILDKKAEILLKSYDHDDKIEHVDEALQQLTLIDEFIDIIEQDTSEEQSQLHWRKEASKAYSKAIRCANILNKPELVLYFNEKSKALLLTESILSNAAATSLPKDVLEKEKKLKKQLLKLESDLVNKKNDSALKDSLFSTKRLYQKFTDSLKLNFPGYFNNKFRTQLFSLKEIQKHLDNNTIIINYNWNTAKNYNNVIFSDNTIYGIAITKEKTQIFSIANAPEVQKDIIRFRELISKPFETTKEREEFNTISNVLFNILIPAKIKKEIKNKHILIIPDGDLQNMPFEALITNKNTDDYLIKTNAISYAYSMSFLMHNQSIDRETNKDFIGFAPVTFANKGLSNLNQSEIELNAIHNIIGGEKYLKAEANKASFFNRASESKIIHLATHAQVSSDPWVAFSDTSLKLHELYTHKINADLVVLSACNTAVGEQFQGEGVFNLARGFFYSGANAVVSSHWSVNDATTSSIMQSFYTNLKQGESKSEALRHAQLNYINTHELSQASPYYWAPFVLVGDYNNASLQSNNIYLHLVLALLILIGIVFFLRKKIRISG